MERIVKREGLGFVEVPGPRDPAKLYSDFTMDPDGTVVLLEWSDTQKAARDAEVAAWEQERAKPAEKSLAEQVAALQIKVAELEALTSTPKP